MVTFVSLLAAPAHKTRPRTEVQVLILTSGKKRRLDAENTSDRPSKKLRMLADEFDKSTQDMELLKGRYNALTAAYDAEVRMYDKSQTKIQTMQSRLNELEANQTRFDTKLRDLQTSIKNKDYQIRSDAVRIAMLEVDKRHITEKLEKAEKGWLAFKGLEDVFERKA